MEASLVYKVSSRTAKDTQRNPVSKDKKKKERNNQASTTGISQQEQQNQ
jgi:hypothetical protein